MFTKEYSIRQVEQKTVKKNTNQNKIKKENKTKQSKTKNTTES